MQERFGKHHLLTLALLSLQSRSSSEACCNVIDSERSSYLAAQSIGRTPNTSKGYNDRGEQQGRVLPDYRVSIRSMLAELA